MRQLVREPVQPQKQVLHLTRNGKPTHFWCVDEMAMLAGSDLPPDDFESIYQRSIREVLVEGGQPCTHAIVQTRSAQQQYQS